MIPNIILALKAAKEIADSGFAKVDEGAYQARLAVCQGCTHLQGTQCDICTCYVGAKARFATESCPLAKWPGDQPAKPYVDPAEYRRRTAICEPCEYRRGRRCSGCSCDLYTLARLQSGKCPKNKWDL